MKTAYLLFGLLLGGTLGFFFTKSFYQPKLPPSPERPTPAALDDRSRGANWLWSDTLDALHAAPTSHKVVYEDSTVRTLQVVLAAKKTEPVHTHRWRSIMWFTHATPMLYYQYGARPGGLVLQDSIPIAQMPAAVLNQGAVVQAEAPHAIKNLSNQTGIAYRVEFKKE
jgi:hypothetical protein